MSIRRLVADRGRHGRDGAVLLSRADPGAAGDGRSAGSPPSGRWTPPGPDALVLAAAGLLAWAVWAWGAPGSRSPPWRPPRASLGAGCRGPGPPWCFRPRARRSAAGCSAWAWASPPLLGTAALLLPTAASAAGPITATTATTTPATAPASRTGRPGRPAAGVPDWPGSPSVSDAPDRHRRARRRPRRLPVGHRRRLAARSAAAGNADRRRDRRRGPCLVVAPTPSVIGPDPDLLLPGQVLAPRPLPRPARRPPRSSPPPTRSAPPTSPEPPMTAPPARRRRPARSPPSAWSPSPRRSRPSRTSGPVLRLVRPGVAAPRPPHRPGPPSPPREPPRRHDDFGPTWSTPAATCPTPGSPAGG